MTKNSGDWEGLQGHDDDPAQFKHKAWVHEGGVAYIYIYICRLNSDYSLLSYLCYVMLYSALRYAALVLAQSSLV